MGEAAEILDPTFQPSVDQARPILDEYLMRVPGYDSAAAMRAGQLEAAANAHDAALGVVLYAALWRVAQGDTTRVRDELARLREMARDVNMVEVGRLLLEAMVESMHHDAPNTPHLDRLEAVMRQGPLHEGSISNLLIARIRERQGRFDAALAAARRRGSEPNVMVWRLPAYLREEGRLSAIVGDTTAAIRAYQHLPRDSRRSGSRAPAQSGQRAHTPGGVTRGVRRAMREARSEA